MTGSVIALLVGVGMMVASIWAESLMTHAFWLLGVAILCALWDIERAIKRNK